MSRALLYYTYIYISYYDELWNGSLFASLSTEHRTFKCIVHILCSSIFASDGKSGKVEWKKVKQHDFSASSFGIAILGRKKWLKNLHTHSHREIDAPCIWWTDCTLCMCKMLSNCMFLFHVKVFQFSVWCLKTIAVHSLWHSKQYMQ